MENQKKTKKTKEYSQNVIKNTNKINNGLELLKVIETNEKKL